MATQIQVINARLNRMRALAVGKAPRTAAVAMGHAAVAATQVTLSKHSHPPGTRTTSPPGDPPAVVTGALRRSVTATPPMFAGRFRFATRVGATVIYARIHELGGDIRPTSAPWLHWVEDGTHHMADHVTIPRRPYLRPTIDRLEASGTLAAVGAAAFWGVIRTAI